MSNKVKITIAVLSMILLIFGAAYAYYGTIAQNLATSMTITGDTIHDQTMVPVLVTKTTELNLNASQIQLSKAHVGKKYYATPSGDVVEESNVTIDNGEYILATASVLEPTLTYNCEFNYDVKATATKQIEDLSDTSIHLVVTGNSDVEKSYTLKELLEGVTITGVIYGIRKDTPQNVMIKAYIENTVDNQEDIRETIFTITIEPIKNGIPFSCNR